MVGGFPRHCWPSSPGQSGNSRDCPAHRWARARRPWRCDPPLPFRGSRLLLDKEQVSRSCCESTRDLVILAALRLNRASGMTAKPATGGGAVNHSRLGAGLVGMMVLLLWASAAHADQVYHSQHYALSAVDGASLRSGFVENIHANGPNVYAHENYVLNGAAPNTSYQVVLSIWASNTTCSGVPTVQIPSAIVETNGAGNGKAQHVFTPEDADGFR